MKRLLILALLLVFVMVSGAVLAQDDAETGSTVALGSTDELGAFLVDSDGMTLYILTADEAGSSVCSGGCAENWPPLTVEEGEVPTLAPGIPGQLTTFAREDGSIQVAYNGAPLYGWVNDEAPGDTTGQGVNDVWFVASLPTVGLGGNDELGQFLAGSNGLTLYTFANDEAGVSNCSGDCAVAWPPLSTDSAEDLGIQAGLLGDYGVIEREDGSLQITLNDMPLYYWQNDEAPGDATGHNVGDVWFVAKAPTLGAVENDEFGQILVGSNGMTLYTFANDEEGVSNCSGDCAVAWPPLTVSAEEEITFAGEAMGEWGTIEREDGSLQVTYNGAPLYYWVQDVVPGDTTGHNVGDVWFVAQP